MTPSSLSLLIQIASAKHPSDIRQEARSILTATAITFAAIAAMIGAAVVAAVSLMAIGSA